jgi:hypothetical protein
MLQQGSTTLLNLATIIRVKRKTRMFKVEEDQLLTPFKKQWKDTFLTLIENGQKHIFLTSIEKDLETYLWFQLKRDFS